MKNYPGFLVALVALASCTGQSDPASPDPLQASLVGTWQLVAATSTVGDSTYSTFDASKKMIKIINQTHFAFLNHDLNNGQDSTATFVSGGGTYALKDSVYSEFLEYCNYREWENNSFDFTIVVQNDTLIQQGRERVEALGIDRVIVETYVKLE